MFFHRTRGAELQLSYCVCEIWGFPGRLCFILSLSGKKKMGGYKFLQKFCTVSPG